VFVGEQGVLMLFRQSLLRTWMECPLQAKFAHIDRLPGKQGSKATFGSAVHLALEHYNRTTDVDAAVRLFLDAWEDPGAVLGQEIDVWNKFSTFGGLRERGIQCIRAYADRMRWEQRTVIAAEHRFLVPFGRHELTGTVDLLVLRRNHRGRDLLVVEDMKTNARRPNVAELALNIQFTVYIYATLQREFWFGNSEGFPAVYNAEWWWETLVDLPRRGIWIQLWEGAKDFDAGGRDDQDFGRMYRLCEEIERAVEHDVYVPRIGEPCLLCDYANDPCPVKVPTRDGWEHQRLEEETAWL
jgi:hypothetical protein